MKNQDIILVPYPKKVVFTGGAYKVRAGDVIFIQSEDREVLFNTAKRFKNLITENLKIELPIRLEKRGQPKQGIIFKRDDKLPEDGYSICISPDSVLVLYKSGSSAFYAVSTLKQLIVQCGRDLPCLDITDEPDFKVRSISYDISRNKIPTMSSIYRLIDFMVDLKLNQLQFYIEGFPFAYPSYPQVWENGTPVTTEEIIEIDRYCKENFIELVPCQNSMGHMDAWLGREEFHDLAECPDGFYLEGRYLKPMTINPLDNRAFNLVETIIEDYYPCFCSDKFNVCCDETFEVGQGKSSELAEKIGSGRIYLNYLLKIYAYLKKLGKTMMFAGDMILRHPELVPELPKDVIAIVWGYFDGHPTESECEKFKLARIPFYVEPGTGSWNSVAGKTTQMKENLVVAAENGMKYGAIGYLNSDWGDGGHWQYPAASYAGFAYGAALCWGLEQNRDMDIACYLDKFIFKDKSNTMGQFVLNIGDYYLKEKLHPINNTSINEILSAEFEDKRPVQELCKQDFNDVAEYIESISRKLDDTEMTCWDAGLIYDEYKNTIRLLKHGIKLGILKLSNTDEVSREFLKEMAEEMNKIISEHKKLWLSRNRPGGLEDSSRRFYRLLSKYMELLRRKDGKQDPQGGLQ